MSTLAVNTITNVAGSGSPNFPNGLTPSAVVSSSCGGSYSNGTTSYTAVTNLSVTITATGKPVVVSIQPDGGATPGFLSAAGSATGGFGATFAIYRDGVAIAASGLGGGVTQTGASITAQVIDTPGWTIIDTPTAGSHTYAVYSKAGNGNSTAIVIWSVLSVVQLP